MFSQSTEREQRLDDLIAQYFARLEAGNAISPEAWAAEYPEFRDELRNFFLEEQHVERFTGPLRLLLQPGLPEGTRTLGDYRLIRELGRGGMGIVYEAEQLSLGRRVALKVLPFAAMLDERQLRRFKNEAHAAAVLKHPHIVSVYAVGCERGTHFYVMELVEGHSLADAIRELRTAKDRLHEKDVQGRDTDAAPSARSDSSVQIRDSASTLAAAALPTELSQAGPRRFRAAAGLAIQAAEALAYAHREGIIHRDIKPANLLLDRDGKLWITDFGLARLPSGGDLTLTGDVLGTLRYMSPEQLAGERIVDQRTDVYSLGLTLYELLASRPAFTDERREQLVRRIMEDDPPSLRSIEPGVPRDLETIVLRATAKDREARYQTAQELADDLRRFLDAKPIRARRTTRIQRLRYWARRNPGVAVLTSVVFVLLAVAAVAGSLASLHMARLAKSESDIRADTFLRLYASDMNRAKESLDRGDLTTALLLLERYSKPIEGVDPRGFEWYFLWEQCQPVLNAKALPHLMNVFGVAFSPPSPSGPLVVTSQWSAPIHLWNPQSGQLIRTFYGHTDLVLDVDFTPDGTRIVSASGDATARVFDVAKGSELKRFVPEPCEIRALSIAPHVPWAALGVNEQFVGYPSRKPARIVVWNYETGEVVKKLPGLTGRVEEVAFSPDGKLLVAGCHDDKLRRWDTSIWEELPPISAHANGVLALAFSADGNVLATSSGLRTDRFVGGEIKLWRLADGKLLGTIDSHRDAVRAVKFVKSTSTLITGAEDGELAFWDVADPAQPKLLRRLLAHSQGIFDLAVSHDEQLLVSTGNDNVARIWNVRALMTNPDPVVRLGDHAGEVLDCEFDHGGSAIWACGIGGTATLWDIATGGVLKEIPTRTVGRTYLAASPEDRLLIVPVSQNNAQRSAGRVVCYDTATSVQKWTFDVAPSEVNLEIAPARRADGVRLVGITTDSDLIVLNAVTGSEIKRLSYGTASFCFSPDGRLLAVAMGQKVRLFDTTTWDTRAVLQLDELHTRGLAFSPDSRRLATGGSDKVVTIWDIASGEPAVTCTGHDDYIYTLDYSPDGKRIVSAGKDSSVRLWDAATGECVLRLSEPQGWVIRVRFSSPDGRQIAAASIDRYVHVWRLVTPPEVLHSGRTLADTVIDLPPSFAGQPIEVTPADWRLEFYQWEPTKTLDDVFASRPIREQRTRFINFDWGLGAPAADVARDYFGLVATARVELAEGKYTLTTLSDDGVRVYVDGQLVIDDWVARPLKRIDAQLEVKTGRHDIRIEYVERTNVALLQFGILPTKP